MDPGLRRDDNTMARSAFKIFFLSALCVFFRADVSSP
jgi:hypothetical protein